MSEEPVDRKVDMDDPVDPSLIFETLNAHQRSAALRGAIELDLFSTQSLIVSRC